MARPKFETTNTYKKLTFEELFNYLNEYGTEEEKKEFKTALFTDKNGKPTVRIKKDGTEEAKENFLNAKKWFCGKFAPELLPVKKEEKPKVDMKKKLADW